MMNTKQKKEFFYKTILLAFVILALYLYVPLNKPRFPLHFFSIPLDYEIPVIPFFVVFYLFFHSILVYGTIFISFFKENKRFRHLALSIILANSIAFLFYIFLQSGVNRPAITGIGIFSVLVSNLYSNGLIYNAFPSGHAYHITIICLYWLKSKIKKSAKIVLAIVSAVIIASTLLIKQHYILDALAGVTLGAASYFAVLKFLSKYDEK